MELKEKATQQLITLVKNYINENYSNDEIRTLLKGEIKIEVDLARSQHRKHLFTFSDSVLTENFLNIIRKSCARAA
ncbi:hypothetical protein A3715_20040 [Oleiphilus sp. HI0009]|nr:hypothetical protein A3715_20040 [Oleiphilus sp. HI0009]